MQNFASLITVSKKAALVFRAINNNVRQDILRFLHNHPRSTVTSIYVKLRMEQSVASQHLAIMRKQGVVTAVREGKFIYYSVNEHRLQEIEQSAKQLTYAK